MFTSESWQHTHLKLHHPEHHEVACQKNLPVRCATQRIDLAVRREFNTNEDSVEYLNTFPNLEHLQNTAHSESQLPPHPLLQMESNPGAGAPPRAYITELRERDAQGCLQTNVQRNP